MIAKGAESRSRLVDTLGPATKPEEDGDVERG